jgi:hypothetical protein
MRKKLTSKDRKGLARKTKGSMMFWVTREESIFRR